tara:strand:+ start:1315 stop:1848 length:534 start_codon:yes stop_codon:yes gene_type:complete
MNSAREAIWNRGPHTADIKTKETWTLIAEMRLLTGYSWGQIALLLGVDRRTVQNWMNRERIREANLSRVHGTAMFLRFIDRGLAERNVRALQKADERDVSAFKYASMGNHGKAADLAGEGEGWVKRINFMREGAPEQIVDAQFAGMTIHPGSDGSEMIEEILDRPAPKMTPRKTRKM